MPENSALGPFQPCDGNIRDGCTSSTTKQRNGQGTLRQDEAGERPSKSAPASKNLLRLYLVGLLGTDEKIQDPIATYLTSTQIEKTPNSNVKAGRTTSVVESRKDHAIPVTSERVPC